MAHKPFVQEKAKSHRPARMAELLKEELSTMIGELKDPRLSNVGFLTITKVDVASDLKNANIFFAMMGENAGNTKRIREVTEGLNNSAGFLRRELMPLLNTKVTPILVFKYDKGFDNAMKIEGLLKEAAAMPKPVEDESSDDPEDDSQ